MMQLDEDDIADLVTHDQAAAVPGLNA